MKARILLLAIVLIGCDARPKPEPKPAHQRLAPVQIFDLRTKCQAIVDKDVEDFAIAAHGDALTADVTSHYNPVTNHCYAEVVITKNFSFNYPKTPTNYLSNALYDAQTRDLLLMAERNGDKESGNDFRTGGRSLTTFEQVSNEIHLLMTQEDQ